MARKKKEQSEELEDEYYGLPDYATAKDWAIDHGRIIVDEWNYRRGFELGMEDDDHYYPAYNTREPESYEELHNMRANYYHVDPDEVLPCEDF